MPERIGLEAILQMAQFQANIGQYTQGMGTIEKATLMAGKAGNVFNNEISALIQKTSSFKGPVDEGSRSMMAWSNRVDYAMIKGNEAARSNKNLAGSFGEVSTKTGAATTSLSSMATTVGKLMIAYYAARQAVEAFKKVYEFSREGAEIQRLEDSSSTLARVYGGNMDDIVTKVRAASLNSISNYQIMQSSARAMMFGLGADADQFANLMQIAAFRGRAMGRSASDAFNDIVIGIGRMSPLILDNLGIIIDSETTYTRYADQIGKTSDSLTAMEKRYALLNSVIDEGNRQIQAAGGFAADSATIYEQWGTNNENLINDTKRLAGVVGGAALVSINSWMYRVRDTSDVLRLHADQVRRSKVSYEDYRTEIVRATTQAGLLVDENGDLITSNGRVIQENYLLSESERKRANALEMAIFNTQGYIDSLHSEEAAAEAVADALAQAALDMERLNYAVSSPYQNEVEKYTEKQEDLRAKMEEVKDQIDELQADPYLTQTERGELDALIQKYKDLEAQYGQNAADHQDATNRILWDLLRQQAMMDDEITPAERRFLEEVAKSYGIFSEQDAAFWDAATSIMGGIEGMQEDIDGTTELWDIMTEAIMNVPPGVEVDMDQLMIDLAEAYSSSGGLLEHLLGFPPYVQSIIYTHYIEEYTKIINGEIKGSLFGEEGIANMIKESLTGISNFSSNTVYPQASGGPQSAYNPYLVGDMGVPEVVVPDRNGYTYPSEQRFEDSIAKAVTGALSFMLSRMQGNQTNWNVEINTQQNVAQALMDIDLWRILS